MSGRMVRAATVFAALVALSTALPLPATADGDPASDFLLYQPVFTPRARPTSLTRRLTGLAEAAERRGFAIRVAVIQSRVDLGSVPELFGKPQSYARFLGAELRFAYTGRLLVVMSNGYGYTKNGEAVRGSRKLLDTLPRPAGSTPDQLTAAAIIAIRRIAADAGHPLPANPRLSAAQGTHGAGLSNRSDPLALAVEVLLGGILLVVAIWLVIRRQRGHGRDPARP
jgi:hypothetical protein